MELPRSESYLEPYQKYVKYTQYGRTTTTTSTENLPSRRVGKSAVIKSDMIQPTPFGAWRITERAGQYIQLETGQLGSPWAWSREQNRWFRPSFDLGPLWKGENPPSSTLYMRGSFTDNALRQAAIDEMYSKLKNQAVNFSMQLATFRKTSSLLTENLTHIGMAMRYLRTGQYGHALRRVLGEEKPRLRTRMIAKRHLEYSFGLTPLLIDAERLAKQLKQDRRALEYTVTGFSNANYNFRHNDNSYTGNCRARCKVRARVTDPFTRSLSEFGFSGYDLLATLFDIIPWSFVLDWVVGITKYLEQAGATVGQEFLSGYVSYSGAGEFSNLPQVYNQPPMYRVVNPATANSSYYYRELLHEFPPPNLAINDPLNLRRLLYAASLLRTNTNLIRF